MGSRLGRRTLHSLTVQRRHKESESAGRDLTASHRDSMQVVKQVKAVVLVGADPFPAWEQSGLSGDIQSNRSAYVVAFLQ